MTGMEVSQEEIENARDFLAQISGDDWPMDGAICQVPRDQIIRCVAWYGAIRSAGRPPTKIVDAAAVSK